ncbi:hypothetical protein, partial [Luteimonas sp. SDU101]|uniref:hypothetical protein n=1 Tax=Luteimonas sp. SDU101 TaxID=3422593 RepID=UPI003EC0B438
VPAVAAGRAAVAVALVAETADRGAETAEIDATRRHGVGWLAVRVGRGRSASDAGVHRRVARGIDRHHCARHPACRRPWSMSPDASSAGASLPAFQAH